jgi:hypothetical protein
LIQYNAKLKKAAYIQDEYLIFEETSLSLVKLSHGKEREKESESIHPD